jgi:transcriptional regulator with XRE-family HTH domain
MKTPTISPSVAKSEIVARTKALRAASGHSQQSMADALRISFEAYKKYETRSPLPHHLMAAFTAIVNCDINYLVTGKGAYPKSSRSRLSPVGTDHPN